MVEIMTKEVKRQFVPLTTHLSLVVYSFNQNHSTQTSQQLAFQQTSLAILKRQHLYDTERWRLYHTQAQHDPRELVHPAIVLQGGPNQAFIVQ